MKFALRDDDLNFFFEPSIIEKNYKDIWNICPASMSVIPYIKGNWLRNFKEAEGRGPGIMDDEYLEKRKADNLIYPIDRNPELIAYVNEKIKEKKIYLTLHAIHHRNEDPVIPQFTNNFGLGAEFYTTRDLTSQVRDAIIYIEGIFGQPIEVFTPPQNLYSMKGLNAVLANNLAICGDLPDIRSLETFKRIGLTEYLKFITFKLLNRSSKYPFPIINKNFKMVGHHRLQPGTDLKTLYDIIDKTNIQNGVFILSTHSYGFDFKMKNYSFTMGDALKKVIEYATTIENIQFVNLKRIFERP